jgi:threonine dehydrogenase-like Zn-dependent dehydrogenase/alkylhydroperoxidase/carboxymuconolactone decarboxylase family protein YurZ
MRSTVIHAPRDIRLEDRPDPTIVEPTDAVIRTVATCVCGSDLWRYRGIADVPEPTPIGHEYVGVVEAVGDDVTTVKPGEFVVGGFLTSDNTCALCKAGAYANCQNGTGYDGCQAELIRVQNADGTLIATPEEPEGAMVPSILALSDVMGTGWHAAVSADVKPGSTVVVVGDGAVGLSGVLAASQLGAERVIVMSRHEDRQRIARDFGATDIVAERGDEGVERVKELTGGVGADAVLECVGTQDSVPQALRSARPGAMVGWVGVPHVTDLPQEHMFWKNVGLRGGPAPVRAYLPDLLAVPYVGMGKVFDFLHVTNDALADRGVEMPLPGQSTTTTEDRAEKGLAVQKEIIGADTVDALYEGAPEDQRHIQRYLSANCFGDHYTRTGVDIATRELLTFAMLVALGGCEPQVRGHVAANVNVGNDRARLIEVVTQLLPYIGYPRTLNGLRAIDEIAPA